MTRLHNETGVRFERFGIAYAEINNLYNPSSSKNFTIEIAIKPEISRFYKFDLIMTIHDGKDSDQLIIGQWQTGLIIMNGDDYSHKRKTKRISADIFNKPFKKMMLTVKTGDNGTRLYINGKLIKSDPDLTLMFPAGKKVILTLGNSVYGNNSWNGNIYGFALYDHHLPNKIIENHFKGWKKINSFTGYIDENPLLLFDFDKSESSSFSEKNSELIIPAYFPLLKKRILEAPWVGIDNFRDMIINLLGLMPLGFILYALFLNLFTMPHKKIILITILICFVISLFIEITQAWIPSRSSQSLDLILNAAGGGLGAYGAYTVGKLRRNR